MLRASAAAVLAGSPVTARSRSCVGRPSSRSRSEPPVRKTWPATPGSSTPRSVFEASSLCAASGPVTLPPSTTGARRRTGSRTPDRSRPRPGHPWRGPDAARSRVRDRPRRQGGRRGRGRTRPRYGAAIRGDPDARVSDAQHRAVAVARRRHLDLAARPGVLEAVFDEVAENLAEAVRVGANRHLVRRRAGQGDPGGRRDRAELIHHGADHRQAGDRAERDREPGRLERREVEQLVDEPLQPVGAVRRGSQELPLLTGQPAGEVVVEGVQVRPQDRQRGLELVGGVGDETVADAGVIREQGVGILELPELLGERLADRTLVCAPPGLRVGFHEDQPPVAGQRARPAEDPELALPTHNASLPARRGPFPGVVGPEPELGRVLEARRLPAANEPESAGVGVHDSAAGIDHAGRDRQKLQQCSGIARARRRRGHPELRRHLGPREACQAVDEKVSGQCRKSDAIRGRRLEERYLQHGRLHAWRGEEDRKRGHAHDAGGPHHASGALELGNRVGVGRDVGGDRAPHLEELGVTLGVDEEVVGLVAGRAREHPPSSDGLRDQERDPARVDSLRDP